MLHICNMPHGCSPLYLKALYGRVWEPHIIPNQGCSFLPEDCTEVQALQRMCRSA